MFPKRYDVIVAGGGPSGIAAAVAAARLGASVALVERYGILGGMLTSGHVNPVLGSAAPGTMADELMADDFEDCELCDSAYESMFTENWLSRLITRLFNA